MAAVTSLLLEGVVGTDPACSSGPFSTLSALFVVVEIVGRSGAEATVGVEVEVAFAAASQWHGSPPGIRLWQPFCSQLGVLGLAAVGGGAGPVHRLRVIAAERPTEKSEI